MRQGDYLDGIQFVTNYGRYSTWFGGAGGDVSVIIARKGKMIVGLKTSPSEFCPKVVGIIEADMPKLKQVSLQWLMTNPHTQKLVFGGKPSVFTLARKGKPSIYNIIFKGKPRLITLLMEGDEETSSVLRLFLSGEQNEEHRFSHLRLLCSKSSYLRLEHKNIMQILFQDDTNGDKAIIRYMFQPCPGYKQNLLWRLTVAGQTRLFMEDDTHVGSCSLMKLLALPDTEIEEGEIRPSLLELTTYQEANPIGYKSLLRLLAQRKHEHHSSILDLLLEGKNENDFVDTRPNSVIKFSLDKEKLGYSSLRRFVTPNRGPKGYAPSVMRFLLKGEAENENSLLRLLLQAEEGNAQKSILRLMAETKYLSDTVVRDKKSILQIILDGDPSLEDVLLEGELNSDESLVRLFLGFNIDVVDDKLSFYVDYTNKRSSSDSLGLLSFFLLGEENGGPGISILRLLLLGEEKKGFSIMRLLLVNEEEGLPSLARIALVATKIFLLGLKQRKTYSKWGENLTKMTELFTKSQQKSLDETIKTLFGSFLSSVQQNCSSYPEVFAIIKSIPSRGKQFGENWKSAFEEVAELLDSVQERVQETDSIWKKIAPFLSKLSRDVGHMRWIAVVRSLPMLLSNLGLLVKSYRTKHEVLY